MLLELSKLLQRDGAEEERQIDLEMTELKLRRDRYRLLNKSPLALHLKNEGNRILRIEGKVDLTFEIPCARCLTPVSYSFSLEPERKADMKLSAEEREKEADEVSFLDGEQLDPEQLVRNELLLHWPIRVLCDEACKGICSHCGQNLNEAVCDCDRQELDPRMAVISDIFRKHKEV